MSEYTVFLTYNIASSPYDANSIGLGESIHCNYIQKFTADNIEQKDISFYFNNVQDFQYLNLSYGINTINAIVQIIDNSQYNEGDIIKPLSDKWKKINVTNQINDYSVGDAILPEDIINTIFKISYNDYDGAQYYNLDYLSYPNGISSDSTKLSLGEESFFFGNVVTNIEAIAYTTDITVTLPIGEFNTTTNPTWDGESNLYITEVGIYDDDNNLVAIGKLNTPISKSDSIGRSIVFAIDF